MRNTKRLSLQAISKLLYILGVAILLNGILLSAINLPVNAMNGIHHTQEDEKVQICHWTEANRYVSINVSVSSVASSADWNSSNGHGNHANDIWPEFTAKNGDLISASGNQNILNNDCKEPSPTSTATKTKTATITKTPTNEEIMSVGILNDFLFHIGFCTD